jgi:ribonuclease G
LKREILINGAPRETRVAILEDDTLVELLVDRPDTRRTVGDIYLGKVEAVLPGIQAAFVDIGAEKSAFLHASDLVEPEEDELDEDEPNGRDDEDEADAAENSAAQGETNGGTEGGAESGPKGPREFRRGAKLPPIQDLVKRGETLLVQVSKEPIGTKGPRVTRQISIAGRFLVYMPYASRVGVSRKIESREERARLRQMVTGILPKDSGGVIVRTVGEEVTQDTFKRELESLLKLWKKIVKKQTFVRAPALIQRETSLTRGIIRDLFSAKVDHLAVDSKELHHEIMAYLDQVGPELKERVELYEAPVPLFDKYEIESEIRDLFKRRVDLPSGGYVIIEHTEALVSVDVNTGRYTGKKDPEKTILKTNVDAAREVARQLRLRDIGGIIVVDFIDMETRGNKDKVLHELRTYLARDRARTRAFAVSELGLVEMTRQRVRPSLFQSQTMPCPTCTGTGRVLQPETVVRRLERSLKRASAENQGRRMTVRLHPEVALYLLEEEPHFLKTLAKQTGIDLEIRDDPMMKLDELKLMSQPAGRDVTESYLVA